MTPERKAEILSRECGPCFSCCIHLGINELNKWPGQACTKLDGTNGPEKRCSIYPTRPGACQRYKCGWLQGLGGPTARPDNSGLLITPYDPHFPNSGTMSATITITDKSKCGSPKDLEILIQEPLNDLLNDLLSIGCKDIRIISYEIPEMIHILDGKIYRGQRQKSQTHEELVVATLEPPAGRYELREQNQ